MTLFLLCNSLDEIGGVQRVVRTLADEFIRSGTQIELIGFRDAAEPHRLSSRFHPPEHRLFRPWWPVRLLGRRRLEKLGFGGNRIERLRFFERRRAVRELRRRLEGAGDGACIAMDVFAAQLLAEAAPPGTVTLFQFHNSFGAVEGAADLARIGSLVGRIDALVALTAEDARAFEAAGLGAWHFVNNPLPYEPPAPEGPREKLVVSVGRFTDQKAYDLLLQAWALAGEATAGWRLEIHGRGPQEDLLRDRLRALGLGNAAILPPTDDVPGLLSRASIYALSSAYEGLPMVLLEALAFGVPVVATDCSAGVRQLVAEAGSGLVGPVGDAAALAENLKRLLGDPALRQRLGEAGRAGIRPYLPGPVVARWRSLIADLRAAKEGRRAASAASGNHCSAAL